MTNPVLMSVVIIYIFKAYMFLMLYQKKLDFGLFTCCFVNLGVDFFLSFIPLHYK